MHHPHHELHRAAKTTLAVALSLALAIGPAAAGTVRYYPAGSTPDARVVADILGHSPRAKPMKMRGGSAGNEPAVTDRVQVVTEDDAQREHRLGSAAQSALLAWQARVPGATPEAAKQQPPGGEERANALALAINFDNDSAALSGDAARSLDAVAQGMKVVGTGHVFVVEGHTSATGSFAHNLRLSSARALSVTHYLVQRGVAAAALRPVGMGPRAPLLVADPAAPENRRVQFRAA